VYCTAIVADDWQTHSVRTGVGLKTETSTTLICFIKRNYWNLRMNICMNCAPILAEGNAQFSNMKSAHYSDYARRCAYHTLKSLLCLRPHRAETLSDDFVWRQSVCLSVAYIGPKSRTERPKRTKIGTEVAHVTRDSDTTFKVKRSKVNLLLMS